MIDKQYVLDTFNKVYGQDYESYNKRKLLIENSREFTVTMKADSINGGDLNVIDVIEDGTGNIVLELIEREDGTVKLN